MIQCGHSIRLTRREADRFTRITALPPPEIRSLDDLNAYVRQCKDFYWGVSHATQFLHWLIDQEYERCVRLRDCVRSPRLFS